MHQGRTFLVKTLDLTQRVATVRPADIKYYTVSRDFGRVHVTGDKVVYTKGDKVAYLHSKNGEEMISEESYCSTGKYGSGDKVAYPHRKNGEEMISDETYRSTVKCESAVVVIRFIGFSRVWQGTGEVFDNVDLALPDIVYETVASFIRVSPSISMTVASYIRVPPSISMVCSAQGLDYICGLHGAGHALLNVLPLHLLGVGSRDVAVECSHPMDTRFHIDRLLLFDKQHGGGMGLAKQAAPIFHTLVKKAFELVRVSVFFPVFLAAPMFLVAPILHTLMKKAFELVRLCPCTGAEGCPRCIQHLYCTTWNSCINKPAACLVLELLLDCAFESVGEGAQLGYLPELHPSTSSCCEEHGQHANCSKHRHG
eukprot:gene8043-1277_t